MNRNPGWWWEMEQDQADRDDRLAEIAARVREFDRLRLLGQQQVQNRDGDGENEKSGDHG